MTDTILVTLPETDLARAVAALDSALFALNIAPRFRCGLTDSYRIAAEVERALAQLQPLLPSAKVPKPGR